MQLENDIRQRESASQVENLVHLVDEIMVEPAAEGLGIKCG